MKWMLMVGTVCIFTLINMPVSFALREHRNHPHHAKLHYAPSSSCHRYHVRKHRHPRHALKYKRWLPSLPICTTSYATHLLHGMNQNTGRALPNPCKRYWWDRIALSGGINFDVGKWGDRDANITGENYQHLSLNDIYINIDAYVNQWVNFFASISFSNPTINRNPGTFNNLTIAEYDAAYSNNINPISPLGIAQTASNRIQLEQAYATIGNFDVSPVYLQFGKQFQDFSRYEIHPITASMTQVISEILASSAKLGVIAYGYNGSFYVLNDPIHKVRTLNQPNNWGISFGYKQPPACDQFMWDMGAGFIHNLIAANDVAYSIQNFNGGGYRKSVEAYAVYGDFNTGPLFCTGQLTINARYTFTIQRFSVFDLPKNGVNDFVTKGVLVPPGALGVPKPGATGAKPWAAGLQIGYGFMLHDKPLNAYIAYQTSREASGINLPRNRYLIGFRANIWHWTSLDMEWDRDYAYRRGDGGSHNITNLLSLRMAVKFN